MILIFLTIHSVNVIIANKCSNQQNILNSVHIHAVLCRITCIVPFGFNMTYLPAKCNMDKILIKLEACLPHQHGLGNVSH